MRKSKYFLFFLIISLCFGSLDAYSAAKGTPPPTAPPPTKPAPCPPNCPPIPVDGGIGILIAAGLAYGGFKVFRSSRKRGTTDHL